MNRLSVNICGVDFKNPVITASGTFNFGHEFKQFFPLSKLGGISLKGLTLEQRQGNDAPRIAEVYGGILNSVGLQNPGLELFKKGYLNSLTEEDTVIICNIAGSTKDDYIRMAEEISETKVDMIELNISCPNVKAGGLAFGVTPSGISDIVTAVKSKSKKPLIVKLTPNVASIADNARAAEGSGADCISLINTLSGMAINHKTKKPILMNNFGGLSGACVKPIALKMVHECFKAVKIPIIGMGGIMNYIDALEFIIAGASAIQIGTANLIDPYASTKIINDLQDYCQQNMINNISELTGSLILN